MVPDSDIPKAAVAAYLEFILRPATTHLVSLHETTRVLAPLGIEVRLICRARLSEPARQVLVVATSDPHPVVALHGDPVHPLEGRVLETRRQVSTDSWEYEITPTEDTSLHGELLAKLSHFERHQTLVLQPPLLTLAAACGWGNEITGIEADAALDGVDVAIAVSGLLIGEQAREHHPHNQYERFRAARAISDHFAVEAFSASR